MKWDVRVACPRIKDKGKASCPFCVAHQQEPSVTRTVFLIKGPLAMELLAL